MTMTGVGGGVFINKELSDLRNIAYEAILRKWSERNWALAEKIRSLPGEFSSAKKVSFTALWIFKLLKRVCSLHEKIYRQAIKKKAMFDKCPLAEKFKMISESFKNLSRLRRICIVGCSLIEIPSSIFEIPRLQELDLSHNKIAVVSSKLGSLRNLENLNLSYNKISELPASIGDLSQLRILRASGNKLERFPESIRKIFETLQFVDFYSNSFSFRMPEELDAKQEKHLTSVW